MAMTLRVRPGDDGIIVTVSGEVDVCTEGPLQRALVRIMRERGAGLLVDVSGVSFMDCAGLRVLLTTQRRAELRGGFMRLTGVSRAVRRIIELAGAHEALAVGRELRTVRPNSFLPNGPDATHRQNWMSEDLRLMVRTGTENPPEPPTRTREQP
ncbi:MAG: STAS domain-containing protein [Streptosporangiaceae bacterium]